MSAPPTAARPPGAREQRRIFQDGEEISGAYVIRGVLGEGAMGQVYEAHDLFLNRQVAIKVLWPDQRADVLRREAEALAAVQAPGTVQVHAFGVHRGVSYLVMEKLTGITLEALLSRQAEAGAALPLTEALDLGASAADALAAVSLAAIAHRDVKPANLMLVGSRVVLTDFGLVVQERTADMAVGAGTPTHLAPEVIAGTVRPGQAHLADLYALGVVLFELFAGCLPFESPSVVGLMASHLGQRAPSLLAFRPDAPPALAALLAELLAKEPEDRPASAALVAWQLRRIRASIRSTAAASPFSVLIIDDDPIVMQLMQRCASSALPSSRVEVAADAQKALRLLRRSPPDLILLDLNLPGMSGVELCMYLRGSGLAATSTIVCVSVAVSPGDERLLRLLGVSRTLHKTDRFFADLRSLLVDLERRGGPSR